MEIEIAAEKMPFLEKAVTWVRSKGYNDIKTVLDLDEFDTPKSFTQSSTNSVIAPDITGISMGRKCYFEVALKSENERQVVNKWKLLSHLAGAKQGKLIIFAPHGHKAFAKRIIEDNQILAEILPL